MIVLLLVAGANVKWVCNAADILKWQEDYIVRLFDQKQRFRCLIPVRVKLYLGYGHTTNLIGWNSQSSQMQRRNIVYSAKILLLNISYIEQDYIYWTIVQHPGGHFAPSTVIEIVCQSSNKN